MIGSDESDERLVARGLPGGILMWIVVMLAALVALGWLVKTAIGPSVGTGDSVVPGAAPATAAAPLVAAPAVPGTAGSTGPAVPDPNATDPTGPARTGPASTGPGHTAATRQPGNDSGAGPLSVRVAASWVATVASRTGIPDRALTAYADAQLATNAMQPDCHLSWVMLAGIGSVESGHGSHGGAVLRPDGTPSIPIVGPPLDGTGGTVAVRATPEGVRLDGDVHWDHAIGPMQFLPSTWSRWGVSADGGVPNPDDIDDATLTAGRYLCANGHDLSTVTGWRAALAAYNAPDAYAVRVTDAAAGYARESLG